MNFALSVARSGASMNRYLKAGIVVFCAALITASTLAVHRQGKDAFKCYEAGPNSVILHRDERGIPLIFVKRSVSVSSCAPASGGDFANTKASSTVNAFYLTSLDKEHEQFDGYAILLNLIVDVLFWAALIYLIINILNKATHKNE